MIFHFTVEDLDMNDVSIECIKVKDEKLSLGWQLFVNDPNHLFAIHGIHWPDDKGILYWNVIKEL